MQITVEIPESKADFVLELFESLPFLKIKTQDSFADFADEWKMLSANLPQTEPNVSQEEIMQEIRSVRRKRSQRLEHGTE